MKKKNQSNAGTKKKNQWKAWLYLLPAIVILAVFTVWPIFNTVRMSLLNGYNGMEEIGGRTFEFGFSNFVSVANYRGFTNCLGNTLLLCVITVPISTMLALLIAVALNSIKFVRKAMQTIFFLPYVTNSIAIGMVFMAMFTMIGGSATTEPQSIGIINSIIEAFGGTRINWVNAGSSKAANMVVLVIYIVWNALPFKILVLLGGLQGVNKQYYDAAKIDGTSRFRTFWRITVPLLSPMIAYVVITGFIGGFKEYSSVVGIFGDSMGPTGDAGRLNTMVGFIYDSLAENKQGRASAAALILFAIIFVVTMINMYVSKKKVHY
ncbi:MAG: sugar ABC transporter permease [Clostridia bacterium]|nr:sugar ABC transporter permease [Clostridia bacterium]